MGAKLPTFVPFRLWRKFEKQKDYFNEIWLIIGYYGYIYITEIKFEI